MNVNGDFLMDGFLIDDYVWLDSAFRWPFPRSIPGYHQRVFNLDVCLSIYPRWEPPSIPPHLTLPIYREDRRSPSVSIHCYWVVCRRLCTLTGMALCMVWTTSSLSPNKKIKQKYHKFYFQSLKTKELIFLHQTSYLQTHYPSISYCVMGDRRALSTIRLAWS